MYSDENITELNKGLDEAEDKYVLLLNRFVGRRFTNDRAREYATHGYARRARILLRCIKNVFRLLPPELEEIPDQDDISDAAINIQASVLNAFGAIDNLAWIWVYEKNVRALNGKAVPKTLVGLGEKCEAVRRSFSVEMQAYLKTMDPWFQQMGEYRHALAHRIPLYIPPLTVPTSKADEHRRLDDAMEQALRSVDIAEYKRLEGEQLKLGKFQPVFMHSFQEGASPVILHAQLLANFNTVEDIGRRVMIELGP